MNKTTMHFLLGRWLDTEYQPKLLANVSAVTFSRIKSDMLDILDDCTLTDADIKSAWKQWFEWATYNGTLLNSDLQLISNSGHDELRIVEMILNMANRAIDNL